MQRTIPLILCAAPGALALLSGCGFELNTGDLRTARSEVCLHAVDEDQDKYIDRMIKEIGVPIIETNEDYSTATALFLFVKKGFWDQTDTKIAQTLGHERVHYCQRSRTSAFDAKYINPAFQFVTEVPAYRQTVRIKVTQRATCRTLHDFVERLPDRLGSAPYTMGSITNLDEAIPIVWLEAVDRCGPF